MDLLLKKLKKRAIEKGLSNLEFFVSDAAEIPKNSYDLACI